MLSIIVLQVQSYNVYLNLETGSLCPLFFCKLRVPISKQQSCPLQNWTLYFSYLKTS